MSDSQFAQARRNMVDSQILPNRVSNEQLIEAFAELPREMFVPTARKPLAYADESILIDGGRYLMQPMILARLLDVAEPRSSDVALVIGAGSGYSLAILSRLVDTVVAIESNASLVQKAEKNLRELGIDNVAIVDGDLTAGHPNEAPYDLIVFDGAVSEVPEIVAQQLTDGGRLVAVEVGASEAVGRGVLVTKFGASVSKREVFDAREPLLPGYEVSAAFTF